MSAIKTSQRRRSLDDSWSIMSFHSKKLTFAGSQNDELSARLDLPEGPPKAFALFAHCFTCGKDFVASSQISRTLAENKVAVLRFDFTGLGKSCGEFGDTNFSSNVDDLVVAADYLRQHFTAPSILVGHSLGGAAVLAAAHRIPEVRAVATVAAPADPGHVVHLLRGFQQEIEQTGEAEVPLFGRPFRIRKQFLDDVAGQPQRRRIQDLNIPLLLMHSPQDKLVSIDNATTIYNAARHPKSFVSIDGGDHLLTNRRTASYVAGVIAAWVSPYLG